MIQISTVKRINYREICGETTYANGNSVKRKDVYFTLKKGITEIDINISYVGDRDLGVYYIEELRSYEFSRLRLNSFKPRLFSLHKRSFKNDRDLYDTALREIQYAFLSDIHGMMCYKGGSYWQICRDVLPYEWEPHYLT